MRSWLLALIVVAAFTGGAFAQEDKKTDDLKPADPDTGESTVEEATLGLLPNPFEKQGVKFAVTYIGEVLGNPTGGAKQGTAYEDRINFAADVDFEKLIGLKQLTFHANVFQIAAYDAPTAKGDGSTLVLSLLDNAGGNTTLYNLKN